MILNLLAPSAVRMATSFRRDVERDSMRPARLAHASSRTAATAARSVKRGLENCCRKEASPRAALGNSMCGASAGLKFGSGPLVVAAAKIVLVAASAWLTVTPAFSRAINSSHGNFVVLFG